MEKRILAVDDDLGILMSYTILLSSLGYTIKTSESGIKALDMIPGFKPQGVISDTQMPEMQGDELCRKIKAEYPAIFVIESTGHVDMEGNVAEPSKSRWEDAGANELFGKPFRLFDLQRKINLCFEKYHE